MHSKTDNYTLLLSKLEQFIKKFYINKVIRGSLLFLGISILAFMAFNLLESQFYFSGAVRKTLLFSYIIVFLAFLGWWVVVPMLHYFKLGKTLSYEEAAKIIGQHFSNVEDKLLNVLQLKKQSEQGDQLDLVLASIDQKSEEIKVVPFKSAIDLSKNRKYLKYALPPLMLLIILLFAAPSLITDPAYRIINNDKHFEPEAPFHFELVNKDLEVLQFENYDLEVAITGNARPDEVFIDINDYQYRLSENKNGNFQYTFRNIQEELDFKIFSGKIESQDYKLRVLHKPVLSDFSVYLDYPAYTGRVDEQLSSSGDFVVPQGTKARWDINTGHTKGVTFSFSDNKTKISALKNGQNSFQVKKNLLRDINYKIYVSNEFLPLGDSTSYSINVIPDLNPVISVESIQDSLEENLIYFIGNASDDYGLRSLSFNYFINKADGSQKEIVSEKLLEPKGTQTPYNYILDINDLNLEPGDQLSYYFEVYDNDAVNGSKSARTDLMIFAKASLEELKQLEEENDQEIKASLEENLEESKRIREELKKLKERLLQKNELSWQDRKELEELLKKQEELQKKMEEAKEKFEENLKNQEEFDSQDPEMEEKQEKLQELFEETMSKEMQDLLEQIQELLQELEKDNALEMMQEMEMNDQNMEQNMDRLLELYKQLEVEKEANKLIEDLQKLAEEQNELSQETINEEKTQEELQKEQEEISEKFEELMEDLDQLEEKNKELEVPKDLGEQNEEQEEGIKEEMDQSEENLEKKENNKASQSMKKASEKMQQMAQQMQSSMEAGEMEQMQEDIQALRQLLENLVNLSFDQEDLIDEVNGTNVSTPTYVGLVQDQFKLKDDFSLIQDSLFALAKRVVQIESFITEKVNEVEVNLEESLENLENRQKPLANDNQRRVMKNTNDLAVMLSETMQNLQQQMSAMAGACPKPGENSQKGQGNQGNVPMDKITEGQEGMGEKLKEMMEGQKQGNKKPSSKEFAQAAARQAALRKALEEIQRGKQEQGKGDPAIQELIDQMDKIEVDLVNKRLNNEMLKRQQDILTRLLEAEKAEREREYDNKRLAERTQEKERKYPPEIEEYIKKKESEIEMYKTVSPALKPYYKYLVEEYYKSLKENK